MDKKENVNKLRELYELELIVKQDTKVKPGKFQLEVLEKFPEFLEEHK